MISYLREVKDFFFYKIIDKEIEQKVNSDLDKKFTNNLKLISIVVLVVILLFGIVDLLIVKELHQYKQLNIARFLFSILFMVPITIYFFKSKKTVPSFLIFVNVFAYGAYLALLSYLAQDNQQALFHNSIGVFLLNLLLFIMFRLKVIYNLLLVVFHFAIINMNYIKANEIEALSVNRSDLIIWFVIVTIVSFFVGKYFHSMTVQNLLASYQIEKLAKSRYKLFGIISHDLKNIIASQYTITDHLYTSYKTMRDNELDRFHNLLHVSSKEALQIFEDLMLWMKSQIDALKPIIAPIEIKPFLKSQIDYFSAITENKNISITTEVQGLDTIQSDLNILGLALRNIISNAIKYSKRNSKIKVTAIPNATGYQISVKDSGVGMSSIEIDQLLKTEMVNSINGTNNEKGSGMGLILTKELLNAVHGNISISSEKNVGTLVNINIPSMLNNVN